jgi:hypothetical protein
LALTAKKVRLMAPVLGLDLLNGLHHLQVLRSLTDQLAFIWLLVKDEAVKEGLDEEAFERRLHGVGYANKATRAFLKELESFSRNLGMKEEAQVIKENLQAIDKAQKTLNRIRMEQAISGG